MDLDRLIFELRNNVSKLQYERTTGFLDLPREIQPSYLKKVQVELEVYREMLRVGLDGLDVYRRRNVVFDCDLFESKRD